MDYMTTSNRYSEDKDELLLSTPRKRTRATPEQLSVLEKTFNVNPSPNNRVREQLSRELGMSERSIQIWFQNRRAKVKNIAKKSSMLHDETLRMQYYASSAAAAACQAAAYHQHRQNGNSDKEIDIGDPMKTNPDLYYYYYYYYFNQQQQLQQQRQKHYHPYASSTYGLQQQQPPHYFQSTPPTSSSSVPPPPISLKSMPPPPPPPPARSESISPTTTTSSSGGPLWSKKQVHQQRARAHTIGPYYPSMLQQQQEQHQQQQLQHDRGNSVEVSSFHNNKIPFHINTNFHPQDSNFTNVLNSPTSSTTQLQHDHQFSNLTIQDNPPFLPFQSNPPSFFEGQQPQQLAWTDLPFYQDPTAMMTPTTPSNNMFTSPILHQPHYDTQKISAEALQIGTWKRMGFEPNDLICQFDKDKKNFSWCIQDGLSKFKMEFNQSSVQKIQLSPLEGRAGWARLEIEVNSSDISFYMEVTPPNWVQCRDYTEDKQASHVTCHQLDGPALALKAELDSIRKENSLLDALIV
ncbi:unnamed protein product [Mucor hiemalis]